MPRTARKAPGGVIFHVLNRGVGRRCIFGKEQDYGAFERVLVHALTMVPLRLLCYCLMPNHWHLILWPRRDGELGQFMQRLTMTHTRRWQEHYHQVGVGHLYQGRFKSFPVQQDDAQFLKVARYVERNALRANLVSAAEQWRWSSLWRRVHANALMPDGAEPLPTLSSWPVEPPADWIEWVNHPQSPAELDALRLSVVKGRPFGNEPWQREMTERLGLESSHRGTGRPKKNRKES